MAQLALAWIEFSLVMLLTIANSARMHPLALGTLRQIGFGALDQSSKPPRRSMQLIPSWASKLAAIIER